MQLTKSLKIIVVAPIAITALGYSTLALASSHTGQTQLRKVEVAIDAIVTGANKSTTDYGIQLPATSTNSNCPLCYHRELMKKQQILDSDELQPFPED